MWAQSHWPIQVIGLGQELVPGLAGGLDDVLVGFENAVRQPVLAEVLPDFLDRVQLPEERQRIISKLDEAGAAADDHRRARAANPIPLDTLLREVNDRDTAQQLYLASGVAINGGTEVQSSYLLYLQQRLKLDQQSLPRSRR